MKNSNFSRRKFIKGAVSSGLLVAGSGLLPLMQYFQNVFRFRQSL